MMIIRNLSNNSTTNLLQTIEVSNSVHYVFGCFYTLIGILATPANAIVLFVLLKNDFFRCTSSLLIFALCVGDLMMCLIGITMLIISSFSTFWIFGETGCKLYGMLMTFLGLSQIFLLACIAVVRYMHMIPRKECQKKHGIRIIWFCYMKGFLWSLGPLFGWSRYTKSPIGIACDPLWTGLDIVDMTYKLSLFVFAFVFPVLIITYSYTSIFMKMRTNMRRRRNDSIERNVTTTMFLMIVFFFLSWTPYTLYVLYIMISGTPIINPIASTIPLAVAKSAPIWNPYIYFYRVKKFKAACVKEFPVLQNLCFDNQQDERIAQVNRQMSVFYRNIPLT